MRVTWSDGGDGEVAKVDDLHVTVLSSRAFPPGMPAKGTLHADAPHAFTLKVAASRREGERFRVQGRLVSATVAVRAAFQGAVPPG